MADQKTAETATAETKAPAPSKVPPKNPLLEDVFVLDTTCTPSCSMEKGGEIVRGMREHVMLIDGHERPFLFHYDRPTKMKFAVALKFLKHEAFKLCDENMDIIPWRATPRQPHELREGEKFRLEDDQIVARLDELHIQALRQRICQMPGGEAVVSGDKPTLIAWLVEQRKAQKTRDVVSDLGPDEFVPPADLDEDDMMAA